jgi:hypothetical protein
MFGVKKAIARGMADRAATLDPVVAGRVTKAPGRVSSRRRSALAFEWKPAQPFVRLTRASTIRSTFDELSEVIERR